MLTKKPQHEAVKDMQIGDPYTFILDEPIRDKEGQPAKIGGVIDKWFSTAEPARLFEIVAIHHESVYETKFVGFHGLTS